MPMAIAFVLTIVFTVFGLLMQKRESKELHAVFDQHLRLVTRVIEVATEHALRDGQHEDLHRMIALAQSYDDELNALVTDGQGRVIFTTNPDDASDPIIREMIERTLTQKERLTQQRGRGVDRVQLTTAVLNDDTMPDSVLVVSKSMRVLEEDLQRTRAHAIIVTAVMALFTLFFGLIFAHLRVRGPLIQLRNVMNTFEGSEGRVGDYPPPTWAGIRVDNEVRAVRDAFSELMDRLTAARKDVEVLHAQRESLVEQLVESTGRAKLLQFSSELAHEIGSPLQVILGRAMMLHDRADNPDQVRRHAGIVVDEATRIQRIVEKSLSETADADVQLQWISIADRARRIADLHRERESGRHVPIHVRTSDPFIVVFVDEDALDQILRNLLSNAYDACLHHGEIVVEIERMEQHVRLSVRDTGSGMDEETLQQALQPFFSTRQHAAGHGFGLPIVQRLCRDLDIQFDIRSKPGQGTIVTLLFGPWNDTAMEAAL